MHSAKLKRIILQYYAFQFFFSLLIWLPIFYEFQKRIGLSDGEIFRIQSIYYLVFCFLEIPTGLLADRWGTKGCMVLGAVIVSISQLFPVFFPSYLGMLGHFLALALARSLISGASSAYIYEFMEKFDAVREYKKVEGRARAYGLYGKVACWAVVGVLMQWHLNAPYWATFFATALSTIFAALLPSLPVAKLKAGKSSTMLLAQWKQLHSMIFHRPILLFLIIQGVGIFVLGRICQVNLFQPILSQKQFSLPFFGWVMAAMTLTEGLGSAYPHLFRKWINDFYLVYLLSIVMGICLGLVPWLGQIGVVLSLLLFSLAAGLAFPVQRQLVNDAIPSNESRATILSMESILDRAVCAWVAAMLGSFLDRGQLDFFLVLSSSITVLGILLMAGGYELFSSKKARFQ